MQTSLTAFRGGVDSAHWAKERLDSWKEVASFFRREVRTVQLWEKSEGLPVRRQHHKKLGSVYAYRRELEAWWAARSAVHATSSGIHNPQNAHGISATARADDRHDICRIITATFETIHSPLDRGPLQQIVEKFAEGLKNDLVVELVKRRLRPIILPVRMSPSPVTCTLELMKHTAAEFGGALLLNGSIRYSSNHVRISVQMIRASDLLCLWSDRFDAGLDNVLASQAELARRIAVSLPDPLENPGASQEQDPASNRNLAAHACTVGFYYWQRRGRSALERALSYFQDAIELEPRCADAYAGLADTYVSLSYNHLMPAIKAAQEATSAVDAAKRLERDSVRVRNSLVNLLIHCTWDLAAAESECRDMLESGAYDVRTLQLYSTLMNLRGRHQDAIALALHAYRLAPESDLVNGQVSLAYFYAGDYASALSYIRRTIDLEPQFLMGYALLGRTEAELGNWDEALKAFERGLEISSHCPFLKALLAYAYAGGGDAAKAQDILHELEAQSHDECFPAYDVSAVHAILNQESEALKKIYEAFGARDMKTIFVSRDPRFARLRNSSGFQRFATALSAETTSQ
jgi:TolB-like protein/exonuclease VII small subunit